MVDFMVPYITYMYFFPPDCPHSLKCMIQ